MSLANILVPSYTSDPNKPNNIDVYCNNITAATMNFLDQTDNVRIGWNTMASRTTAADSIAIGDSALRYVTTGNENVAIGRESVGGNSAVALTGDANIGIGRSAMDFVRGAASSNVAIGFDSFNTLESGSDNIAIGDSSGDVLVSGSNNIYIGVGVDAASAAESNVIRLGNSLAAQTYINGVEIINTSAPAAADVTIVAADLLAQITLINNAATIDVSAAQIDAAFPGIATGNVLKLLVVNTQAGASAITLGGGATNVTLANPISIAQNDSRVLYFRRSAATPAYVVY